MADSLREQIARAMRPKWFNGALSSAPYVRSALADADTALAAIEAAGFVIVPARPTEKMVDAAFAPEGETDDDERAPPRCIYRAMIAARPKL